MKKSELIEKLSAIAGDPEVGIGYWDMSLKLADVQESTSGGIYEPFVHLIFSNDPLKSSGETASETVSGISGDAPVYSWDEEKVVNDPNGNRIRCYVIKKNGVVIGYMRKSQSGERMDYDRAQGRNTRFRYFKMTGDVELLGIARRILGGDVWGAASDDDSTENFAPLFYTE